jgi:AraC-like DNA-binding protein
LVREEISKILDFPISIGIGDCQGSVSGISESLNRAEEALKYKLISGHGSINFWYEVYKEDYQYYYPYSYEKYIFNILNTGGKEKLEESICEMIQVIKDNDKMSCDNVSHIFNQLIGNTIKLLLELPCNVSMIFGNNYNMYNVLSEKETLEDIKNWLIYIYSTITDYLSESRLTDKGYFKLALDYIHENYKKDIDINVIADYAGVSYSYLRKIFKDETGDNIVNYINMLRINESKQLLRQTDLTIKEIAANLGYNNDQSFTRFFKKYEGISPGEFRVSQARCNPR